MKKYNMIQSEINQLFQALQGYIYNDDNRDNYRVFADSIATDIATKLQKLPPNENDTTLARLLDDEVNTKILVDDLMDGHHDQKLDERYRELKILFNAALRSKNTNSIELTRVEKLTAHLTEYGFFTIEKVKRLSETGQSQLIEFMATNQTPYNVAMLDHLGFIAYLKSSYYPESEKAMYKKISVFLDCEKSGRTVGGNLRVLKPYSKETDERYTAHQHKETVEKDYKKLK